MHIAGLHLEDHANILDLQGKSVLEGQTFGGHCKRNTEIDGMGPFK